MAQPLQLEVGRGLISLIVDDSQQGLLGEIARAREALTRRYGVPVPPAVVSDSEELELSEFRLLVRGAQVLRAKIMPSRLFIVPSPGRPPPAGGVPADARLGEPSGVWIRPEAAEAADHDALRPAQVIARALGRELEVRLDQLLGLEETSSLLAELRATHPTLLGQAEQAGINRATIRNVLQRLLAERVPITDLVGVLEALVDDSAKGIGVPELVELVRKSLAPTITACALAGGASVEAVTLHPSLAEALWPTEGKTAAVQPRLAEWLWEQVGRACLRNEGRGPIVLCAPEIRTILSEVLRRKLPAVFVVSADELLPETPVNVVAEIQPPEWLPMPL